ncbi:hypothetical protein [Spirillospora sp. NPDC047279]|uniref:hypothetical protein n=1 Tax=Spirillospora sp. NPDC047279 TaxID=3155478 RepID=UPI0033C029C5
MRRTRRVTLSDGSPPGLVRTAEDVPGSPRPTMRHPHRDPLREPAHGVTATPGDTPRVLGRPGPALALRPPPFAVTGAEPTGLPPRVRGVAAGRTARAAESAARPALDHRAPVPYAPAAPASFTAGPAASSSNAAGPAIRLPRTARIRPPWAIVPTRAATSFREGGDRQA